MSLKFGIILPAYNASDTIDDCLKPWLKLGHKISAICVPYEEYKDIPVKEDNTASILAEYKIECFTEPRYASEAEVRNLPFNSLKESKVDYYWLLDSDEIYMEEEIKRISRFVEINPEINWFKINFKNYVFNGDCWIDGFCPPRIFKSENAGGFFWDNDIFYVIDGKKVSYKNLSSLEVPKRMAHVKHLTWINNEKTKAKVVYQEKHFKHGAGCGYRWNKKKNCLEFNMEYYEKTGESVPKLNYELSN